MSSLWFRVPSSAIRVLAAFCIFLPGCEDLKKSRIDAPARPINIEAVRSSYNARLARISQFWSRATVEIDWTDAQGRHFEQGDGPFILRRPAQIALTLGKLGNTLYWIGSDSHRYWYFDLNSKPTAGHVGLISELDSIDPGSLPIALQPGDLFELLGLVPLPTGAPTRTENQGGKPELIFTHAAGTSANPTSVQVAVDPYTSTARRIRILDKAGKLAVESELDEEYIPVKLSDQPPAQWPEIPANLRITIPARQTRIKITLTDPVDGKSGKVQDVQFDFDRLIQILKPARVFQILPKK